MIKIRTTHVRHRLTKYARWAAATSEDWLHGLVIELVLGKAVALLGEVVTSVDLAEATVRDVTGLRDRSRSVRARLGQFLFALARRAASEACARGVEAVLDGLLEMVMALPGGAGC